MFRDSCEVTGNTEILKDWFFSYVGKRIFLWCLHEEGAKSSSCLEVEKMSPAEWQHRCSKLSFHMDLLPCYLEGLESMIWLRAYKSKLVFILSFFCISNSGFLPIFLSILQLCYISKWLTSVICHCSPVRKETWVRV